MNALSEPLASPPREPDVVILGGGLAGLSLARQLLLTTDTTVLLLERREEIPPERQKVGESLVQLGGFYFSKVLGLEEYLLDHHYMKYNLRFYWKTPERGAERYEDCSASYIRGFSNVASYQLDRNTLEAELLRRNLESPRFTLATGVTGLDVELASDAAEGDEPHRVRYEQAGQRREAHPVWVVDTTGRGRFLAKRLSLKRENRIRHGAFFWWVEGRVNPENLTDLSPEEIRKHPHRRHTGHLPPWLATMHFMGDGFWFWVIPLRGKTSLGLVFDTEMIDPGDVFSVEKATRWVCERYPLFARDLPRRKVLDFAGFRSYSHDCATTVSPQRWALAGEAGRFSDPLYSPGSDLIALHNTMIVDAIRAADPAQRTARCRRAEPLLRAIYEAYVPSYADGYPVLGDPEIFALKYGWELAVYFAAYVFPFLNDLFTERRFLAGFLRFFGRLGPLNRGLHQLLADYHRWKRHNGRHWDDLAGDPVYFDFTELVPLARAEKTFYEVGVGPERARRVLDEQLESLTELARFAAAHVAATVAGDPELVRRKRFVETLDVEDPRFDPEAWRRAAEASRADDEPWPWSFDPAVLQRYVQRTAAAPETALAEEVTR